MGAKITEKDSLVPDVKRIAVFRARALGDMIVALPAFQALHAAYPQAEIVHFGHDWHKELYLGRVEGVNRSIEVPSPSQDLLIDGYVIDPERQDAFFDQYQAEDFDLGVQLHGGGEHSNEFVCRLNPRVSLGMKSNRASKLDRWIPYVYYQNEIIRLLEVVGLVGAKISNANLQPHLTILDSDRESAAPYIDKIDRPFIVVHPGSNDARRRWDPENFARVADTLNEQFDVEIVLTGADSDAKEVMAVAQAMKTEPINLLDQLDLSAFIGLLSQTRLYVGNDSGPLHLALASGTKAVGIFMAENMNNFLPLYRSNFYPLIAWERRCPLCGLVLDKAELDKKDPSPCAHQVSMVDSITPEDGIRAAELLLNLP